jgi:hypothetical protein
MLPSSFDQSQKAVGACPFSALASKTRRFDEGHLFDGKLIAETPGPGAADKVEQNCYSS